MKLSEFLRVISLSYVYFVDSTTYTVVWNARKYPLPPTQPPEVIFDSNEVNNYHFTATNESILNTFITATYYSSYEKLAITAIAGGTNLINGSYISLSQISYSNYSDPRYLLTSYITYIPSINHSEAFIL